MDLPEGVLIDMIMNEFSTAPMRKCETCEKVKRTKICGDGFLNDENSYLFGWQTGDSEEYEKEEEECLNSQAMRLMRRIKGEDKKVCAHVSAMEGGSCVFHMVHLFIK